MLAKIIVDASVLVSAYAVDGEVRRYWRSLLAGQPSCAWSTHENTSADPAKRQRSASPGCYLGAEYKIVISPEIFIEVESRLRNSEFALSPEEIKSALKEIAGRCDIVRPSPPSDPRFEATGFANLAALARHCFVDGVAPTYLLTGDDRLSRETQIEGCKILRFEEFCSSLRQLQPT